MGRGGCMGVEVGSCRHSKSLARRRHKTAQRSWQKRQGLHVAANSYCKSSWHRTLPSLSTTCPSTTHRADLYGQPQGSGVPFFRAAAGGSGGPARGRAVFCGPWPWQT